METIAVYKEERVKVYSITGSSGLVLVTLNFSVTEIDQWGQRIDQLEDLIGRFELVTFQACNPDRSELHILFHHQSFDNFNTIVQQWLAASPNTIYRQNLPVDLLYLHGPHFQDRFGIADVAFKALLQNNMKLLVTGCAGTSMYIVTPTEHGQESLRILNETFLIPT